jgi:putative Ca2+/H+ antiporter (TMEM165/GDT1 family)
MLRMEPPANAKNFSTEARWQRRGFQSGVVGFFILFLLYIWFRIEPTVEYHSSGRVFYLSHSFFSGFLKHPGGLVEYAAAFLAQLSYYNWLGAVVFTAMGCIVFLEVDWCLRRINGVASQLAPFGPVFLLLFLREIPDCPALAICMGLLLAMGFAMGYVLLPRTRVWLRLIACPVCSVLLFYLAGLWPSALFAVLAGLFEMVAGRRWALGWGCLLSGFIGPFGTTWFCDAAGLFVPWGGGMFLVVAAILYLYIPFLSVVSALLRMAGVRTETEGASVPKARRSASGFVVPRWFQKRIVKRTFATSLFILGWALIWFGFDVQGKALAQIDYYSSRSEYNKMLAVAANLKEMRTSTKIRVWLALYHTGRLGDDLFSFGNPNRQDMLSGIGLSLDSLRPQSQTLLELGQVDDAEYLACEALENEGETPETLRLLAEINILKGRPAAARVFLNVLGMIPFERKEAERCLRELETNPTLSGNHKLEELRSSLVKTDMPHPGTPTEFLLIQLLNPRPHNQMAFEYLMSYYLLSRQGDKFVARLEQLNNFEYTNLPRHWEEAILLYQGLKGVQVDLHGRQIRPETIQRFQQFCQATAARLFGTAEGDRKLAGDFGGTYWYYYDFGPR